MSGDRKPGKKAKRKEALRRAQRAADDSARDVARLEVAISAVAHERDAQRGVAQVAGERVAELAVVVREARATLASEQAAFQRARAELAAALEARENEVAAMQAAIDSERTVWARDHAQLAATLDARADEVAVAQATLRGRQKELEDARTALQERTDELVVATNALRARDDALAELEENAAVLERQVRRGLDQTQRHGEMITQLREELAVAQAQSAAAERELNRTVPLEQELAGSQAETRNLERQVRISQARAATAELRADRFETSLQAIRASSSYKVMRALWRIRRSFSRGARRSGATTSSMDAKNLAVAPEGDPARALGAARVDSHAKTALPSKIADDRLTVAAILDEMSTACFEPECDLVPLSLDGWAAQIDGRRPQLLLVESAWNGNGGEWQYQVAKYGRKDLVGHPKLRALIATCRERGIPTAFWNKEDPVHFDRFSEAAALFDHVFTTDERCIERYSELPGERTVTPLPFAAQPRIHNPTVAVDERSAAPCFAGAWYRDRHVERRRALEGILDGARPFGLVIYDRTFGTADPAFGFPERFQPHVLGKLPYERVLDVYKSHKVFLNANSVVDSPTMCSRRVFELAACDTAILSTPGVALSAMLGNAVIEAETVDTATEAFEHLLSDEPARRRRTRDARRTVFAKHTYADRLATIAGVAGLDTLTAHEMPFVAPGSAPSGSAADFPWELKLQPGVRLSPETLADMRAATTYANADVIGTHPARKGSPAVEHRPVGNLDPRALLVRRSVLDVHGWEPGPDDDLRRRLVELSGVGIHMYAGDCDWLPADDVPIAIGARRAPE